MSDSAAVDPDLSTPLDALPGASRRRTSALRRLGLATVCDLLRHLPMRYERHAAEGAVAGLQFGVIGSARGMVVASQWVGGRGGFGGRRGGGRKGRFVATLKDDTGRLNLTWFNAAYLRHKLKPGMTLRVQGKTKAYDGYPQMVNPDWEVLDHEQTAPARDERLRPVYPATQDLPSSAIEQLIARVLPAVLGRVNDPLPADLLEDHAMPALADALRMAHQPEHEEQAHGARRRLAFNELLLLQLGIAVKRAYVRRRLVAPALHHSAPVDAHIRQRFPFKLTDGQEQVIRELIDDLTSSQPMNRLLQGDVGSGKTLVALYAMLLAVANRRQAALMAPTELLAEQHHASIRRMLEGSTVRTALLTGGTGRGTAAEAATPEARAAQRDRIQAGEVDIVVGTQALLSESVHFDHLAVVVIDEQHRFGVAQRASFRSQNSQADPQRSVSSAQRPPASSDDDNAPDAEQKTPTAAPPRTQGPDPRPTLVPHHLVMTATPIPRTLSLSVFGDLEVSTIRGLPPGRTPITNRVVSPEKADEVYRYLHTRLARGEQAYVVVPAVDAEESSPLTSAAPASASAPLKSVRQHVKLLQDKYFSDFRVAGIHGRLKPATRERIMDRFRRGEIQVLVATTVIEVGVDVPGATLMVVEHAERFGLAQLHQLRGRIGRSNDKRRSLCVFITDPATEDAGRRMKAIASTNDGFRIAEMDLEIRGMGDFFGTRQSGLPPLRVARIPEDMDLLQLARRDAARLVDRDPTLSAEKHTALHRLLLREYGETLNLIDIG